MDDLLIRGDEEITKFQFLKLIFVLFPVVIGSSQNWLSSFLLLRTAQYILDKVNSGEHT